MVPAGGTASLGYVYSVGSLRFRTWSQLALAAQDRFEAAIGRDRVTPTSGTTASAATTTLSGTASAGSGIQSLVVDGQSVPVASGGKVESAEVPLSSGTHTITAVATDAAGATAQAQVAGRLQPAAPPPSPLAPPVSSARFRRPRE